MSRAISDGVTLLPLAGGGCIEMDAIKAEPPCPLAARIRLNSSIVASRPMMVLLAVFLCAADDHPCVLFVTLAQ